MVKNCNCPSYEFIKNLDSISKNIGQKDVKNRCCYCNKTIDTNKYCSDKECISYWNVLRTSSYYAQSLGKKSGRRERLCLLPTILLEICRDTTIKFYPSAKAWAISQLMEGKKTEWSYVDKLFDGLFYSQVRVPKIKELLNSAYDSITDYEINGSLLYYKNN